MSSKDFSRSTGEGELAARRAKQLEELITPEMQKSIKVKTMIKVGKPYQEIVEYALQTRADMIVMAARGAEALVRAVFGSTTYRVIQLGPCPVLVVHI